MPFPMVHYYIAHELTIDVKINDLKQFYLGILATDAYNQNNGISSNRNTSHLFVDDPNDWEKNVLGFMEKYKFIDKKWYFIGYGVHILTDIYWEDMIYRPFRQNYQLKDTSLAASRKAYITDMTMIDLWLYRNCKFKEDIWAYLSEGECLDVENLITKEQIILERDFTLKWYDNKKEQIIGNYEYISLTQVLEFIQSSKKYIINKIQNII